MLFLHVSSFSLPNSPCAILVLFLASLSPEAPDVALTMDSASVWESCESMFFSASVIFCVFWCFLTQKRLSGRSARPSVRHTILAPIFDAGLTGAWLLRQLGHGKSSQLSQHTGTEWYRLIPWILKDTGEDQVLCESLWYFASGLNLVLCAGNLASSSRSGPQCISEHSGNCFAIWSQDISSIGSRRSLGNFE